MLRFIKMQGAGNDYVFIDCREQIVREPEKLAQKISDRHFGIGSDGLVLLLPSRKADLRMRIFNADGTEAEMCGNAARCAADYAWRCGWVAHEPLRLMTGAGIKTLLRTPDGRIRLVMGAPDTREQPTVQYRGKELLCLSVGNPHAVLFVRYVKRFALAHAAAEVAKQASLNLEAAQPMGMNHLLVRVYERGSGETMACGTGACAAAVAGILRGCCERDRDIAVQMPGGVLTVCWAESGELLLTGNAKQVFRGEWEDGT